MAPLNFKNRQREQYKHVLEQKNQSLQEGNRQLLLWLTVALKQLSTTRAKIAGLSLSATTDELGALLPTLGVDEQIETETSKDGKTMSLSLKKVEKPAAPVLVPAPEPEKKVEPGV